MVQVTSQPLQWETKRTLVEGARSPTLYVVVPKYIIIKLQNNTLVQGTWSIFASAKIETGLGPNYIIPQMHKYEGTRSTFVLS